MHKDAFKFLQQYSAQPIKVDRLITSAFATVNKLSISKSAFLQRYAIDEKNRKEYKALVEFVAILKDNSSGFSIEDLMELFEFVVSPSDKVVNGAVYTPSYIREYILNRCFSKVSSYDISVCDPACGCAGFLYSAAKIIKSVTLKPYKEIFAHNLYGVDIQPYSIARSKILLTLFAWIEGEEDEFQFNLFNGNSLNFDWSKCSDIYNGFKIIVGNPPYVCSRNMDSDTLQLVTNWAVAKSGHPDLYIPFFQIGYENLAEGGVLGLITVNTFIKSINGRALRTYLSQNEVDLTIINFGGEQVFKDKNTYTCLCFLSKKRGGISYVRTQSRMLASLSNSSFFNYGYDCLDHQDGWNLVDSGELDYFIRNIEKIGKPFKDLYNTRNGIATLKNDVYKFRPVGEDDDLFYVTKSGVEYSVEKAICRRIVNANKIKTESDLSEKVEQIIFPYFQGDTMTIIPAKTFRTQYPNAYYYLNSFRDELHTRDKGEARNYEEWYAYGRRQSLESYSYKLFFPHICERPTFVISQDENLLFYNGIAVVHDSLEELTILKSLLESDIFFSYIKNTTKDYSSGYISMSRNYLKNFGIPTLTTEEKRELQLATTDTNLFWQKIYSREFVTITDKSSTSISYNATCI